jgi:hypothetical protein
MKVPATIIVWVSFWDTANPKLIELNELKSAVWLAPPTFLVGFRLAPVKANTPLGATVDAFQLPIDVMIDKSVARLDVVTPP